MGAMVRGSGEFQCQVFLREAPKSLELVGTLGIHNPVWSLFSQQKNTKGLSTFRSLSKKIMKQTNNSYLNHLLYRLFFFLFLLHSTSQPILDYAMVKHKE